MTNSEKESEEEIMVPFGFHRHLPRIRKGFVVRGRVVRHETRSTGFWFLKTEYDVLVIEIDREEFETKRVEMGGFQVPTLGHPKDLPFPSECKFMVEKKERKTKELPINSSVEVTLGYLNVHDQHATHRAALEVLELSGHANPGYRSEDGSS